MENFELNRRELDRYLGAYPYEEYKRWVSLTNNINETFLEKLIPESKIISSGQKLIGQEFKSEKSDHNKLQFEKRFQPPDRQLLVAMRTLLLPTHRLQPAPPFILGVNTL